MAQLDVEVPNLIEQPELIVELGRSFKRVNYLGIQVNRLFELILLLEFARLVLGLVDVQSAPL